MNIQKKENKITSLIKIFWRILFILFQILVAYLIILLLIKFSDVELAKTVLDYIQILIWPVTVMTIAFCFKTEISSLINRIVSGELPGFKFNATPEQKKDEDVNLETKLQTTPSDEKDKLEELINEKESAISTVTTDNQELSRELINKTIELDFERIYNVIFASQIDLLGKMTTLGYLGNQSVIQHFALIRRAYEPTYNDWDLNLYLRFLYDQGLIQNNDNHTINITDKGKAFLQYLSIMNYQKYGI
jgi:hypothetical protein